MTEKVKKRYKRSVLSREPYKRRSESEMIKIFTEVNSGMIGKRAACLKYGVNRNTLALFIRKLLMRLIIKYSSIVLSGILLCYTSSCQNAISKSEKDKSFDLVKRSETFLDANKLDSAEKLIQEAIRIYPVIISLITIVRSSNISSINLVRR
jgi:hypothetical protein